MRHLERRTPFPETQLTLIMTTGEIPTLPSWVTFVVPTTKKCCWNVARDFSSLGIPGASQSFLTYGFNNLKRIFSLGLLWMRGASRSFHKVSQYWNNLINCLMNNSKRFIVELEPNEGNNADTSLFNETSISFSMKSFWGINTTATTNSPFWNHS